MWQSDLATLWEFNGFKFILVAIDCFSERLYGRALKNKKSETVEHAFRSIFSEAGSKPIKLQTDQVKK